MAARAALGPVSVSFGAVPAGAGQTKGTALVVTNVGTGTASWSLGVSAATGTGMSFSVTPSTVNLAAGASATVTVIDERGEGRLAWLTTRRRLTVAAGGAAIAHAVVYAIVK